MHLQREPAARVDGVGLAERVRDLVDVDGVEGDADADARVLGRVLDEDELALLALAEVAEEGDVVVVVGVGIVDVGVGAGVCGV